MKNFLIFFLGMLAGGFLLSLIGGWWIVFVPCFVLPLLINCKPVTAFWSGFLSIASLWIGAALFWIAKDQTGYHGQVLQVFTNAVPALGAWSPTVLLLVITGLVGGLTGALFAWAGQSIRILIQTALWRRDTG